MIRSKINESLTRVEALNQRSATGRGLQKNLMGVGKMDISRTLSLNNLDVSASALSATTAYDWLPVGFG